MHKSDAESAMVYLPAIYMAPFTNHNKRRQTSIAAAENLCCHVWCFTSVVLRLVWRGSGSYVRGTAPERIQVRAVMCLS